MIQKRPTRKPPGKKPAPAAGKKKVGKLSKTPQAPKTATSRGKGGKAGKARQPSSAGEEVDLESEVELEPAEPMVAVAVAEAPNGAQSGSGKQKRARSSKSAKAPKGARKPAADDAAKAESEETAPESPEGGGGGETLAEHPTVASAEPSEQAEQAEELELRVEALLFASGQALATRRLSKALKAPADDVRAALDALQARWTGRQTALELVEVSGGWRLMTRAAYHDDVARLAAKVRTEKLSPAALETLAVVAYRQPIGRADIEAVRGVQCGPLLRVLLDRDLIRITGRSSEPGHPLQYGTTKHFLDHFGLASLKNLPDIKDLLNVS
jgi:segregation and condensation protein B